MLGSLTLIVVFEIAGDLCQQVTGLPIPGPVLGMVLLLLFLIAKGGLPEHLDRAANGLLSYLPLLFVPAGVGVMAHFELVRAEWPALVAAILVSSALAIIVTAGTMRLVERLQGALQNRAIIDAETEIRKVSDAHAPSCLAADVALAGVRGGDHLGGLSARLPYTAVRRQQSPVQPGADRDRSDHRDLADNRDGLRDVLPQRTLDSLSVGAGDRRPSHSPL
jgi:holin-like protein